MKELVNRESQDVAIDQSHSRDTPVFGARTNPFVDFREIRQRANCQTRGKFTRAWFQPAVGQLRPEGAREFIPARSGNISRKEHLQGAFARLTTRTHNSVMSH